MTRAFATLCNPWLVLWESFQAFPPSFNTAASVLAESYSALRAAWRQAVVISTDAVGATHQHRYRWFADICRYQDVARRSSQRQTETGRRKYRFQAMTRVWRARHPAQRRSAVLTNG